jgi:hypothetical protein
LVSLSCCILLANSSVEYNRNTIGNLFLLRSGDILRKQKKMLQTQKKIYAQSHHHTNFTIIFHLDHSLTDGALAYAEGGAAALPYVGGATLAYPAGCTGAVTGA